jgi:hypothetical protein
VDESLDGELLVSVSREGGVTVVAVRGELDAASTPRLESRGGGAGAPGAPRGGDQKAWELVDSTRLHPSIGARAAVEDAGGSFAVACVEDGPVARVIDVALPGMLDTHGSRSAAVAAASR